MSRGAMLLVWLLCLAAALWALLALLWDALLRGRTRRGWNVAIALDQAANAVMGGWPDETLSARAWRLREQVKWARWVKRINRLFRDPDHCEHSYRSEQERQQLAPEYRS